MAKILNKMLNLVGWEIDEEEEGMSAPVENEKKSIPFGERHANLPLFGKDREREKRNVKALNLHTNPTMKMVVVQPSNFNESQRICDELKERKPVILNLENLEKEAAKRIYDFMLGAAYALDGSVNKISPNIFVFSPCNVDVSEFNGE